MQATIDAAYTTLAPWLPWLTGIGIAMALASMVAIPWLIVRMPEDYFVSEQRFLPQRSATAWALWLGRNLLALVLLLAGVLMLVLPGQGILTILIALVLSTFPGKYRLERSLIRMPRVFRAVNWIRRRYRHRPIIHPDQPPPGPPRDLHHDRA